MKKSKEAHYRSIAKALSWILATLTTMLIVFAFTRKPILSIEVGAVEVVLKLLIYYFHEHLWLIIPFGKNKHPLSEISVKKAVEAKDMGEIKKKLAELGYIE